MRVRELARARTLHADRGLDAPAQVGRRRFARQMLAHQPLQGVDALALGCKCRIGRHTLLHCECIHRVEFAIEIGMDGQEWDLRRSWEGHDVLLPIGLDHWSRPRARRDITVPIGTPVTSAISR